MRSRSRPRSGSDPASTRGRHRPTRGRLMLAATAGNQAATTRSRRTRATRHPRHRETEIARAGSRSPTHPSRHGARPEPRRLSPQARRSQSRRMPRAGASSRLSTLGSGLWAFGSGLSAARLVNHASAPTTTHTATSARTKARIVGATPMTMRAVDTTEEKPMPRQNASARDATAAARALVEAPRRSIQEYADRACRDQESEQLSHYGARL